MSEATKTEQPDPEPGTEAAGRDDVVEVASSAEADACGDPAEGRGRRRSKTMSRKEIARELRRQRALGVMDPDLEETLRELEEARPRSRADCANAPRPCMFVSCKHHLYLDVNPETGSIKLNFPDREIWELPETCALDVADRGGITLEEVGSIMNLTRERIRQVETRGLVRLRELTEDEPRIPPVPAPGRTRGS